VVGLVVLDRSPDVAVVGLGESLCVISIPRVREHAAPLRVQGPEECLL
jgi:hypothetical protein